MKQPSLNQLLDDEENLFDSMKRVMLDDGDKILQSWPQKSPWKDKDAASTPREAANGVGIQRAMWQEVSTPYLYISLSMILFAREFCRLAGNQTQSFCLPQSDEFFP